MAEDLSNATNNKTTQEPKQGGGRRQTLTSIKYICAPQSPPSHLPASPPPPPPPSASSSSSSSSLAMDQTYQFPANNTLSSSSIPLNVSMQLHPPSLSTTTTTTTTSNNNSEVPSEPQANKPVSLSSPNSPTLAEPLSLSDPVLQLAIKYKENPRLLLDQVQNLEDIKTLLLHLPLLTKVFPVRSRYKCKDRITEAFLYSKQPNIKESSLEGCTKTLNFSGKNVIGETASGDEVIMYWLDRQKFGEVQGGKVDARRFVVKKATAAFTLVVICWDLDDNRPIGERIATLEDKVRNYEQIIVDLQGKVMLLEQQYMWSPNSNIIPNNILRASNPPPPPFLHFPPNFQTTYPPGFPMPFYAHSNFANENNNNFMNNNYYNNNNINNNNFTPFNNNLNNNILDNQNNTFTSNNNNFNVENFSAIPHTMHTSSDTLISPSTLPPLPHLNTTNHTNHINHTNNTTTPNMSLSSHPNATTATTTTRVTRSSSKDLNNKRNNSETTENNERQRESSSIKRTKKGSEKTKD